MPARKVSNMYYEDGSAARKILPKEDIPKRRANTAVRKNLSKQNSLKRQHLYFVDLLCQLLLPIDIV